MEEDLEKEDDYPLIDDYDSLHEKIVNYLTSGKVHSTLVGLIINLDGDKGKKDVIEATVFADYIINFLKESELMKVSMKYNWQKDSLCKKEKKFVPETKEHIPYTADDFYPPTGKAITEEVQEMCNRCPVQEECLEFALAFPEKYGNWGGVSEKQREVIKQSRSSISIKENK